MLKSKDACALILLETSALYKLFTCLLTYYRASWETSLHCVQKKTPTYIFNYNSGISWSIFIIFVPVEIKRNKYPTIDLLTVLVTS